MVKIPGIPTLLKKLGLDVQNLIFPCMYVENTEWFWEKSPKIPLSSSANEFDTVITEPLKDVEMKIFSVVDFREAYSFSKRLVSELYLFPKIDLNLLGFNCKIQDVPIIKEEVFKQLKKSSTGSYLLEFYKSGSLKRRKSIKSYDLFADSPKAPISVFIHKRSDVNDDMLKRESTITYHHTFHTYGEFLEINPKGYEEVLYSSKELGTTQIVNLHMMDEERLIKLRKSIEKVGFDSITYSKVNRLLKFYCLNTKQISPKEIEELQTGSYRWLVLKAS
jgi:hypothetical protein